MGQRRGRPDRSGTPYGLTAAWTTLAGVGLGLSLATSTTAALAAVPRERGGAGSALVMALRQLGSAIGVAVLGAVTNAVYRAHLVTAGLADSSAQAARHGVSAGTDVARQTGSTSASAISPAVVPSTA